MEGFASEDVLDSLELRSYGAVPKPVAEDGKEEVEHCEEDEDLEGGREGKFIPVKVLILLLTSTCM